MKKEASNVVAAQLAQLKKTYASLKGEIPVHTEAVRKALEIGMSKNKPQTIAVMAGFFAGEEVHISTVYNTRTRWRKENDIDEDCRKHSTLYRRDMFDDSIDVALTSKEVSEVCENLELLRTLSTKFHSIDQLKRWLTVLSKPKKPIRSLSRLPVGV